MVNAVITKPYSVTYDLAKEKLPEHRDESFFMLLDVHGKWRINTSVKGFAKNVSGFAIPIFYEWGYYFNWKR